jgi:lipopolysaccharide transport system ATP-binding protein
MACVRAKNISLIYPIYGSDERSLKTKLLHVATGGYLAKNNNIIVVEALQDISFELKSGDRLAVVGANGAGKSTLLKVLAGIYEPTSGSVHVEGRINCLFDIMMGMDHELNGYENIALRGLILGLSKSEILKITPRVEAFAELGDFLKMPIKSYSSGMKLRLAFGIITNVYSEILLIDEIVNVGDAKFIEKAKSQIKSIVNFSEFLILATHDKHIVKEFCNKVLLLVKGRIKAFGSFDEVGEF